MIQRFKVLYELPLALAGGILVLERDFSRIVLGFMFFNYIHENSVGTTHIVIYLEV